MEKKKWGLTDEQVEEEIAKLLESDAVKLAKHEQRLKFRRRQYLYQLRDYEKNYGCRYNKRDARCDL